MDNDKYKLARLRPYAPTVEEVRDQVSVELGGIDGNRGVYATQPLDWCMLEIE